MANKLQFIETDKPFFVFSIEADRDYLLARLINFSGAGFAPRAGYFGQQALEKYMKAFLVQSVKNYPKTHDLFSIAKECSKVDEEFSKPDFIKDIKIFDDFREVGRYGGASSYDPNSKKTQSFQTAGTYAWIDMNIKILDRRVYEIRGKLDYQKIKFSDSLIAILKGERTDFLEVEWKLPLKLDEILSAGNDFFKK